MPLYEVKIKVKKAPTQTCWGFKALEKAKKLLLAKTNYYVLVTVDFSRTFPVITQDSYATKNTLWG